MSSLPPRLTHKTQKNAFASDRQTPVCTGAARWGSAERVERDTGRGEQGRNLRGRNLRGRDKRERWLRKERMNLRGMMDREEANRDRRMESSGGESALRLRKSVK